MRVLRTEFYPDRSDSSPTGEPRQSGLAAFAVAWFSIPSNPPTDLRPASPAFNSLSFVDLDGPLKKDKDEYTKHLPARFIELSLRNINTAGRNSLMKAVEQGEFISTRFPPIHVIEVDAILDSGIVIERSPPESIPLHLLLSRSTHISLGTFVGSAWPNEPAPQSRRKPDIGFRQPGRNEKTLSKTSQGFVEDDQ
jgi:hypothetical protein